MDEYDKQSTRQSAYIDPASDDYLAEALDLMRQYQAILEGHPGIRLLLADRTPAEISKIASEMLFQVPSG